MPMSLLSQRHHRQVDQLKRLQQGFRCRTTRGAFGIACIQAWQALVLVSQALTALPLQESQDSWFGHFQGGFGNSAQKLIIQVRGKVQQG